MSNKIFGQGLAASRRTFMKRTATAAAAGAVATPILRAPRARAASTDDVLRVALIGCGGRGNGAAVQALKADKNVKLVALADAFEDKLESALKLFQSNEEISARVDVPKERRFVGFDAYKGAIDCGVDVVLLTTPPHFRPLHMQAAVEAGKHVFAEKPVAVDATGVRKVLAACEEAKKKNLAVSSGLCWRYDPAHREAIKRIHGGAIGDVRAIVANDFRGTIRVTPRRPEWTDMTYQMRNCYYFTWLSGDFNVEQHVHLLDACSWVLKGEYPVRAFGTGGRASRTGHEFGHIYDHHAVCYEYESGLKLMSTCRQYTGGHNATWVRVTGTKGDADLIKKSPQLKVGKKTWEPAETKSDKYQEEHDALFASIRRGKPVADGDYMTKSTLMGIMGRMATYTGQLITWEQAMDSQEDLSPSKYTWDAKVPSTAVAVPGSPTA
jgi:predicted dehydrogenase